MLHPQFTLRSLLVAILAICCFLGGMVLQKRLDQLVYIQRVTNPEPGAVEIEAIMLDGVQWIRLIEGIEGPLVPASQAPQ